jgi:hypothetical protein
LNKFYRLFLTESGVPQIKVIPIIAGLLLCSTIQIFGSDSSESWIEKIWSSTDRFYKEIPLFACVESVVRQKIGKSGRVEYRQEFTSDYLVLANEMEDGMKVEESRLQRKIRPRNGDIPALLDTNGLPSLSLIFHPLYRMDYEFIPENLPADGKDVLKLAFQHIPGKVSTSVLVLQGRIYPLELKGTALIDMESGAIMKITADMIAPMRQINISSFHVEVEYKAEAGIWLPSTALIELRTEHQCWRNTHRFSQYRRFTVNTSEAVSR